MATTSKHQVLERRLGHRFADPSLLEEALIHRSMRGGAEAAEVTYERLEFLGDRVLGLVIADLLYARFGAEDEGELSRRHAALVRGEALAEIAESIDLAGHLRLAKGEANSGAGAKASVMADACEAVIAALYLDGGLDAARRFITENWAEMIDRVAKPPIDPKTALQEWAQGRGKALPRYEVIEETGSAHEPTFAVKASVEGFPAVVATGTSKRKAERIAAAELLHILIGGR